jgi:hypothetical protein
VVTNALIGGYRPAVPYPPRKEHRPVAAFSGTEWHVQHLVPTSCKFSTSVTIMPRRADEGLG